MKILFVCTGNTCRSPMAESIMDFWIEHYQLDWQTDSAALKPWNVGRRPDKRCRKVLNENGLDSEHYVRLICYEDFFDCDFILCMDYANLRELNSLSEIAGPGQKSRIELIADYIGRDEDEVIDDPFVSTGLGAFRAVYAQLYDGCRNFVKQHRNNGNMQLLNVTPCSRSREDNVV